MSEIDISVVCVTYNRSHLLARTLESLSSSLSEIACRTELIVADDCSDVVHRNFIDDLPGVHVVRTEKNSGLGRNANNGLSAARGEFILQLQDDWEYLSDARLLEGTLAFFRENPDIGIVQLTTVGSDLVLGTRRHLGFEFCVFGNDRLPWRRNCDLRPYSDQPHIKRRQFVSDIGAYLEGTSMGAGENDYKKRVASQSRWKVAMIGGAPPFRHLGAEASFNPGGRRSHLARLVRRIPFGKFIEPRLRSVARGIDHLAAKLLATR